MAATGAVIPPTGRSSKFELTQRIGYAVPTVHFQYGLRFSIHTDDHEPAHVHVYGDGELKIVIRGDEGLPLITYAVGMKANDRRRAMDVVLESQDAFLARWDEIQGGRR
ncbi:MAG TPA: DUF4160 domain-containing protein [Allosphingosinicella sp.]